MMEQVFCCKKLSVLNIRNSNTGGIVSSSQSGNAMYRTCRQILAILLVAFSFGTTAYSASLVLADKPIYAGGNIPPLVMIDLSKDHQLYFKAYNDYSDLNGDGALETTYEKSISYYGYFDSSKCYSYSTSNHRFEPFGIADSEKFCVDTNAGKWSGNFLNWASMSRMDAIRKLLYGGMRSTDGSGGASAVTVLERSYQPTDAHSWVKYYNNVTDLPKLTPMTAAEAANGISLCNVTTGSTTGNDQYSQTNTKPPLIRVVRGDYALWASNERWQCTWSAEHNASNANNSAISGLASASSSPAQGTNGFGTGSNGSTGTSQGEYVARVQVCVPTLLGNEKCQQYQDLTYKPIGLLQTYGEKGLMKFGLLTGSHTKNISGGVLRRNVTDFAREINLTDGTFKPSSATNNDGKGIVYNLNRMRIYGYNYDSGDYLTNNINSEACNYQMTGLVLTGGGTGQGQAAPQGNCSSWGNPIAEIFLESIRYFAGLQPTPAFNYTVGTTKDDRLGLTNEAWVDPLTAANYCSPLNALIFNPAVSSYDGDQMSLTDFVGTASTTSVVSLTNAIGVDEGVSSGSSWFVGSNGTLDDGTCTAKALTGLGAAVGICPEAPTQKGTYLIAGAAYFAKTNRIRTTDAVGLAVPAADTKSLKVTTYGIQLASNTPSITVDVNGKSVKIIPAYRLNAGGTGIFASGTIVDFKVIQKTATMGKFYVNWEDSNQGGDFDQDVWGILSYTINTGVTPNTISITTDIVAGASANAQGFGYVLSGTTRDGAHFHSGAYNFSYADPITTVLGCTNCNIADAATTVTYEVTGARGGELKDPLWYAAKWGGFVEAPGGNNKPDQNSEWDSKNALGVSRDDNLPADGVPDNYFFVSNPTLLEAALERAFISILSTSSASSVATNSTSLNTGARIYQAKFNANTWSGQVLAYPISNAGVISSVKDWDAGEKIATITPDNRIILTYDNTTAVAAGIPFRWSSTFPYKNTLKLGADNDARAEQRLNWLRGDRSLEGSASTQLRTRFSVLGDIVNSNPQFVGKPNGGYADADYAAFVNARANRTPMLYVGANDGMVHGFSALDGMEKLAFIPSTVVPNLAKLTTQAYAHEYYIDATPVTGDAKINSSTWKTFLVGGLGKGGQGIYALDITNPGTVNSDGSTSTDAFAETNASSIVQWEFTDKNDADLGFTFGRPTITKMANGRWAAIFGNGYNNSDADGSASTTGNAVLYIVFLDRAAGSKAWVAGTDYIKIDTRTGSVGTPNGLATPSVIDVDGDGIADYIYAGDLRGNMWKFDVSSTATTGWKSAFGTVILPLPLYTAKDASATPKAQSITSAPDIVRNPDGGYMVLFGTGMYLQSSDASNLDTQSFYGIWDESGAITPVVNRSNLVAQTIDREFAVTAQNVTLNYRITSDNPVPYAATQRGWYMDLKLPSPATAKGERVVYDPAVRDGRVIFTTVIPSVNTCEVGGTSWLMELDAVTGRRLAVSPLDVNQDGFIDSRDFQLLAAGGTTYGAVSGRNNPGIGITPAPTVIEGDITSGKGLTENKIFSGSSGSTESVLESKSGSSGRLSWREIMR